MATSNPAFLRAWGNDDVRAALLAHLDDGALCSLRLASAECCRLSTPALFAHTRLTFTPGALSRPARMEALARVGRHVQKLTFSMAHTPSTFLPPLLSPADGREIQFLYEPRGPASGWPKYAAQRLSDDLDPSDLGDILTQQYPPIFHAATNVPSFVRALRCVPNLRHLAVSCPDQEPTQRYRRDAVDYALVSLRMAVERAPLPRLEKLTLRTVHPAALLYLRHMPGLGSSPAAGRRWAQIRKLKLVVDSWDFHGPQPGLDHLRIVDDYVRSFAGRLEKLSVTWNGPAGPCPLTLGTSPLFRPPRAAGKLFAEVTSSMSPLPAVPPKPAMRFPRLKYLQVRNCAMAASQMAVFLAAHLETVREFDFQDIVFQGAGSWREAVAPMKRPGAFEAWQSSLRSLGLGGPPRPEADELGYETYRNHVTPAGRDGARDEARGEARGEARDEAQPAPRQSLQLTKASHLLKKHRVRRRRKPRPETDTDTNTSAADRSPPPRAAAAPLRPQISAPILLAGPAASVPAVSAPAVSAPAVAPPAPLPPATLQPTTYSPPPPPPDARHRSPPPPRPPPSFCGAETPRSLFLPFALPFSPPPPDVRRRPPPPPLAAPLAPVPLPPRSSVYSTETPRSLFLPFSLPLSPPMTPPSPAGPMPRLSPYSPAPLSPSPFPRSPTLASLPSAAASAVDSAVAATPAASALSAAPAVPAGPPPSPPRSKARSHLRRLSATIAAVNPNRSPVGVPAPAPAHWRHERSPGTLAGDGHHGSPSHSPTPPSSSGSGGGNTSAASANSNGVQRNLVLEATHQSLADDAEKRISTLRKAREAILTKLTREFCTSNISSHPANLGPSAAYSAGSSGLVVDSGPGVRRKGTIGRLRLGAGANVESRRAAPGEQSSKTQLVPLMIFR